MNPVLRAATASLLTVVLSMMSVMTGCKSAEPPSPQSQAAAPAQGAPVSPPPQQISVDDLVAPIALYPDQLLAQILTASTNAQEVLDGGNWLLQNQNLKGDALTNAAKQAGFSPSMQYLMSFPQVVDNMCQQIDWTRELGENFQADQKGVMDAVQRKRAQAQQTGNLKSSPQMTVDTKKADNGHPYVEIKPANPQVVYVPQYNPVTIYNTPAPTTVVVTQSAATTTPQVQSGVSTGSAVAIGLLSFGVGMAVGSAISRNNYYPYPAWGYGGIYYGGRPYYPPPYRPVYPGYRPAYGYHPPTNYPWTQYNRNVNVNVNNNYYNKFNSNTVNTRNTNVNNINANNRPALGAGNQAGSQPNWKGQSTYQGARPNNANQKPGASMANANPANRGNAGYNAATPNRPNAGNNLATANRPNAGNNMPANRPNLASNPGANNVNRPNTPNAAAVNRPNSVNPGSMNRATTPGTPSNLNRGGDRGYGNAAARPGAGGGSAARPAPQIQNRGGGSNSAFANSGSAKSERTASNRGQASLGAGARGRKS
jgi:Protein of unknown function (DUF3300)